MEEIIANYRESLSGKKLFTTAQHKSGLLGGDSWLIDSPLFLNCERERIGQELAALGLKGKVSFNCQVASHKVQQNLQSYGQVKNVIAVASGKGGVGKSTVAVNLALALKAQGAQVGLLDADLYGPSQAQMLGGAQRPTSPDHKKMNPIVRHGIQSISMGDLIGNDDTAMIWRGPIVSQTLLQLIRETLWQNLDFLIVDLPPGTGDTQLTLAQQIPLAGAVIVTTPQEIALLDARKAKTMFDKVRVPILGLVENMSYYQCRHCQQRDYIFGRDGGKRLAERYGVPLLAQLPLDSRLREQVDNGNPTVVAEPQSELARLYQQMAFLIQVALVSRPAPAGPKIVEE